MTSGVPPASVETPAPACGGEVPALRACGLSRVFRLKHGRSLAALDGVSFAAEAGSMTALVGPDGAGKTTLMRMACGLLGPTSGTLQVLGMDVADRAGDIRRLISCMPQRFGLYEDLTVMENLVLYADLQGVRGAERRGRFDQLLEMTDLSRFTARQAGRLSGGMKQKLALACTLVRTPRLLLLDEPSIGVDPLSRRDLWSVVTRMVAAEGISVLVSTSYMDEAARCAKVVVMHGGHVLFEGTPAAAAALTAGRCFSADMPAGMLARDFQACLLDRGDAVMDAVPSGGRLRFVLGDVPQGGAQDGMVSGLPGVRSEAPGMEDGFMFLLRRHADASPGAGAGHAAPPAAAAAGAAAFNSGTVGGGSAVSGCAGLQFAPAAGASGRPVSGEAPAAVPPSGESVQNMGGRPAPPPLALPAAASSRPSSPSGDAEPVIEVHGLVRRFGDFTAVASTSFTVRRGEVFGLLGPNGAGKTTTFRMLCGLLPASGGSLRVAGVDLRTAAPRARAKVGYVSQKFSLYGSLSVRENLSFFGGVYGLGPFELRRRIEEVLEKFGLSGHGDDLAGGLPGGLKQRLAMAAGLLHGPEILFLDEPTSGIDALARRAFWRQITELSRGGTTVVVTTHFMEEAEYCDRMLIQDAGRVLALGTPDEVRGQGGGAATMEEAFIRIVEEARRRKE